MRAKLFILATLSLSFISIAFSFGFASDDRPIVVAGDANFPPIEYLEDDKPKGLNVELWQELSKAMGRKIEIKLMLWKDAQQKVLNGEADALTIMSPSEERRKIYEFSEPTLVSKYSLFVRSDNVTIQAVRDLEGKRVGVTEGGFPRQVLKHNKKIHFVFIKNYLEGFRLLTARKIDAVAGRMWVGSYTIQKHGIKGLKIGGEPFAEKEPGIAVKKGNLKLLHEINLGIKNLKEKGIIGKLENKWSPKRVVFLTREKIYQIVILAGIIFSLCLIGGAFLWITTLRKQVRSKTEELTRHSEHLEEMVEDRTKGLREAQEELVRKERLAILGQLAGGVGHELRNPLGAIKNAAYFLNMALEKPEPKIKETLEIVEEEVGTSERIISGLLGFARPKPPTRHKVNINDLVQEALSRANVPENVEVVSQLDEALPAIPADPDQLNQVFANIILNAIQAMPEGGQLMVKLEASSPEWVTVSFTDTGAGIPGKELAKVFEPLFTTKAKGIGLGLALTRTLVEGHGGTIEVQSEVGKGSTFTVKLPVG